MSELCSIVVPVHDRAALTRQCLDAILAEPPEVEFEIVVVDDASSDSTPDLLAGYGEAIRVVTRSDSGGFAAACNDGAAAAKGEYLVFLNNDTIPHSNWLDALVAYAQDHRRAAVVGSKLLFPDGTIQHAGVVVCQDGNPRHLYAGFPADHPVVNKSRRFQAVTAACALVRRGAFERVGGFDTAFHNCLEDADLCLRLAERGHEIHYCHESVLTHLESVTRGRRSTEIERNAQLFRRRWGERAKRDDLDYYLADGLLQVRYRDAYPIPLEVSPRLAVVDTEEHGVASERLLDVRSRQVLDLLKETVRLTAHVADLELRGARTSRKPAASPKPARSGEGAGADSQSEGAGSQSGRHTSPKLDQSRLSRQLEQLEVEIYDLQAELASTLAENGSKELGDGAFTPSQYLGYRKLLGEIRKIVAATLPPDATVLVASRGDDGLLKLDSRRCWHFPQDEDGTYAGHYPADSAGAIAHLEELRARGADYLLFPRTSLWWLEHYRDFGHHLESRYPAVMRDEDACVIFALSPSADAAPEARGNGDA
jgi:GT2 family glycosyltransferase